ncbi:hypothetical protein ACLMJK_005171 [Lecanora helva]
MSASQEDAGASSQNGTFIEVDIGPGRHYNCDARLFSAQYPILWGATSTFMMKQQMGRSLFLNPWDLELVDHLLLWLSSRTLPYIFIDDEESAKRQATLYVKLYIFAENMYMSDLQNFIVDVFRAIPTCRNGWFPPELISYVYGQSRSDSPLRRYILETFIFKSHKSSVPRRMENLKEQLDAGNQAFVFDCWKALFKIIKRTKIRDPNSDPRDAYMYHVH